MSGSISALSNGGASARLAGKVAVITGGTSGIGEATARMFVAEGAKVVVVGRDRGRGDAIAESLGLQSAFFYRADVTIEAQVAGAIEAAVTTFGRLDCLFNNAGAGVPGQLRTITVEEFEAGIRLLIGSVFFGIKHAIPALLSSGGGTIINNSSIAAHRINQGGDLYSTAKAAVKHLTTIAGAELGPSGIRVNAISPGAIATPIFWGGLSDSDDPAEVARKREKLERNLATATPLRSSGGAEDIAHAAVFLASDESRFVNAHDLVVDGGRIAMFHESP